MDSSFNKDNKTSPFTVIVEGNIGSGKTTFLNHFSRYENISLVPESLELWQNLHGVNLLEMLYKDPEKWGMPFQSYVTLTALKNHLRETDKPIKLMERSLFSGRYCFVEQMLKGKILHEGMYHVLQEWYNFIHEQHNTQCDLIVYLKTSPDVVYERMKRRARFEESLVPFEYLKELHDRHENWLVQGNFLRPAPVLVIDANLSLESIQSEYAKAEGVILNAKRNI